MSDKQELEKAVADYQLCVEKKRKQVNEAAERIKTIRQVQTEIPNRQ